MSSENETDYEAPPKKGGGMGMLVGVLASLVLLGFVIYSGYQLGKSEDAPRTPMVLASDEPVRVAPEDPGGAVIPDQDRESYDMVDGVNATRLDEIALAGTEQPAAPLASRNVEIDASAEMRSVREEIINLQNLPPRAGFEGEPDWAQGGAPDRTAERASAAAEIPLAPPEGDPVAMAPAISAEAPAEGAGNSGNGVAGGIAGAVAAGMNALTGGSSGEGVSASGSAVADGPLQGPDARLAAGGSVTGGASRTAPPQYGEALTDAAAAELRAAGIDPGPVAAAPQQYAATGAQAPDDLGAGALTFGPNGEIVIDGEPVVFGAPGVGDNAAAAEVGIAPPPGQPGDPVLPPDVAALDPGLPPLPRPKPVGAAEDATSLVANAMSRLGYGETTGTGAPRSILPGARVAQAPTEIPTPGVGGEATAGLAPLTPAGRPAAPTPTQRVAAAPRAVAPPPAAPAPGGSTVVAPHFQIQLGAYADPNDVKQRWLILKGRNADLLGRLGLEVQPVRTSGGQQLFRLRAGPFATEQDANRVCGILQHRGVDCFVKAR